MSTKKSGHKQNTETIVEAGNTGEYKTLPLSQITYSPFNYRKKYAENDLQNFASEILQHGIISPLTVRALPSGQYELVAGERRLRAASIAGLPTVPVVVKAYTEEQVREIQLAENLQRENPHPLHEAFAIGQMQQSGKKIDEIAARLGKSKQFIYLRIRLLALIEPIQEMFLSEAIGLQEAVEIAGVSAASQSEFFDEYCRDWNKRKNFEIRNLSGKLDQFKYDLKSAPFKTTDKKLVPEAGACNTCEHNTATLKSLFPDYAKQAVCNNRECYHKKCNAYFTLEFTRLFMEHTPTSLIFNGDPSPAIITMIQSVKGAGDLPTYDRYDIGVIDLPDPPEAEDFMDEDTMDEEGTGRLNEQAFNEANQEYEDEMEEYNLLLQSGKLQTGLLITESRIQLVTFDPDKQASPSKTTSVTAKDVDTALKAGTATSELLQAEIQRLNSKEERAKQLDREKVQLKVHEEFCVNVETRSNVDNLTTADEVAARLLVYQSMNYFTKRKVDEVLFTESEDELQKEHTDVFHKKMAALTASEYSFLIRNAMACQADGKFPRTTTAYCLYKQAESAGINVESIEHAQQEKVLQREKRLADKISELQKQIEKLKTTIA